MNTHLFLSSREPTLKQYPVGYFRTYTYHPFTLAAPSFANYQIPQRLAPATGFYQPKQYSSSSAPPAPAPVLPPQTPPQPISDFPPAPQPTNPPPPAPQPQQPLLSRPNPFNSQDAFTYQYAPPPAPYNVQQVQFVPCMCPVTVSVGTDLPAEKRSDDINSLDTQSEQTPIEAKLRR